MDPITLSLIGTGLWTGISWWSDKRKRSLALAAKEKPSLAEFVLPPLSPALVHGFTSFQGGIRQFDRVVADGLPFFLAGRSAIEIPPPGMFPNAQAAGIRFYRLVPLAPAQKRADEVAAAAHGIKHVVIASLTLYYLPQGWDAPMVIATGPVGLDKVPLLVGPQGDFAVLPAPKSAKVATEGAPAEVSKSREPEVAAPLETLEADLVPPPPSPPAPVWDGMPNADEIIGGKVVRPKAVKEDKPNGTSKKVEVEILVVEPPAILES